MAAMVIQLLLAHFKEKLDGLILQADVSRDYLTNHIHLQHVLSFGSVDDVLFFLCVFFVNHFRNLQLHLMSSNLYICQRVHDL